MKTIRHLVETTKHLGKTIKHLGKTTKHLVFTTSYLVSAAPQVVTSQKAEPKNSVPGLRIIHFLCCAFASSTLHQKVFALPIRFFSIKSYAMVTYFEKFGNFAQGDGLSVRRPWHKDTAIRFHSA